MENELELRNQCCSDNGYRLGVLKSSNGTVQLKLKEATTRDRSREVSDIPEATVYWICFKFFRTAVLRAVDTTTRELY